MLLVLRGEKKGLRVEIIRIVLQTLTFTSGTLGSAPAYHGSVLLSDSRHGNYLTNKARSLVFMTTLPPLIFKAVNNDCFFLIKIPFIYKLVLLIESLMDTILNIYTKFSIFGSDQQNQ